MTIKYFSMFSGIGGFELGMEKSKYEFKSVGFSEVDKFAESIYLGHFPKHRNFGDATKIKAEEIPGFDFLVGGFPCQAFSHAGTRRGFDDTRGTLFFEIARILKHKRPKYFLLENVRGLLHHNKGETFQRILEVLSDLGYNVQWEILNSKDYGVPQRRERIFIKGYLGEKCGGEVLLIRRGNKKSDVSLADDKLIKVNSSKHQATTVYDINGLSCTLSALGGGQGGKTGLYKIPSNDKEVKVVGNVPPSNHWRGEVMDSDGISKPLTCCDYKDALKVLEKNFEEVDNGRYMTTSSDGDSFAVTTRNRESPLHKKQDNYVLEELNEDQEIIGEGYTTPSKHGHSLIHNTNGISRCVTCNDYKHPIMIRETTKKGYKEAYPNDGVLLNRGNRKIAKGIVRNQECGCLQTSGVWGTVTPDYRIRRLTPVECERLQGFPDNWTKYGKDGELISDTQRYKCCGNAVTTNVITAIVDEMFDMINEENYNE